MAEAHHSQIISMMGAIFPHSSLSTGALSPRSEGDNALGTVCLSINLFV